MALVRRILLFLLTNFLVITTISIICNLLGVQPYLTEYGLNLQQLLLFCTVWGMGGSFISLLMSRFVVKMSMGVKVIPANTTDHNLQQLVSIVHDLARRANLPAMPEVGVYDSPEINAFATGPSKSRSLVAVSSGLLNSMNRDEIAGVLGHEISHVANGDMVTMTLLQGIVNVFVMFFARIIAYALTMGRRGDSDSRGSSHFAYYIAEFVFQTIFMILGSLVVAAFSRWREYRADAGGANLAGRQNMIEALQILQKVQERNFTRAPKGLKTLMIAGGSHNIMRLFASHPPLEQRIAKLKAEKV